jgi:23S rRNA pseudouridine1911/1915/1917 synthase
MENTAMHEVTVTAENEGERLDRFLLIHIPGQSRSQLQKAVVAERVRVNGKAATKHAFLKAGDVVQIDEALLNTAAAEAQAPKWWEAVVTEEPEVLFEDDAIIVINKPANLVAHPADATDQQPSVAGWLVQRMAKQSKEGMAAAEWIVEWPRDVALRPGIVHRLDKPVTGVLVLAKSPEVAAALKLQFQARTVEKEYRAIVYGVPAQETGDIKFAIARSKTHGGKMAARPEHEEGRDAWTSYDVLQSIHDRYAVLSVRIHTGRTHQIRAHLAAIDHPIIGDTLYASSHYPLYKKSDHLFLHSYRLAFEHPVSRKPVEYIAELPEWFSAFEVA